MSEEIFVPEEFWVPKRIGGPKNLSSPHLASWNLTDFQRSWIYKIAPCVAKIFVYKRISTNVTRKNVAWAYVPNILDHLIFVNLGCMPNFSFLSYVEVGKKDVLRVGGSWLRIMPRLWLHLASLAEIPRWSQVWQNL